MRTRWRRLHGSWRATQAPSLTPAPCPAPISEHTHALASFHVGQAEPPRRRVPSGLSHDLPVHAAFIRNPLACSWRRTLIARRASFFFMFFFPRNAKNSSKERRREERNARAGKVISLLLHSERQALWNKKSNCTSINLIVNLRRQTFSLSSGHGRRAVNALTFTAALTQGELHSNTLICGIREKT